MSVAKHHGAHLSDITHSHPQQLKLVHIFKVFEVQINGTQLK